MALPISETSWFRHYRWLVVGYLWVICFLNYVDRSSVFALFPLLRTEFRLSGTALGLILVVFAAVLYAVMARGLKDRR